MKYINKVIAGLMFLSFLTTPAFAEKAANYYIAGSLGLTTLSSSDVHNGIFSVEVEADADTGINFGGAIGYRMGNLRGEFEIARYSNDLDSLSSDAGSVTLDGDIIAVSYMVNAFYDFQATISGFKPYMGVGIGVASIDADLDSIAGVNISALNLDASDTVFAYKLALGSAYEINQDFDLTVGYHYFGTDDPDLDDTKFNYDTHNFNAGVRYSF